MADNNPTSDAGTGPLWPDARISSGCAVALCAFLIIFFFIQIFWLFGFWPRMEVDGSDWLKTFMWFVVPAVCESIPLTIEHSQRLVIIVLVCGGIGAQVHTIASFAIHMAHRDFSRYWIYWYLLRPFQGAVVAFVVYFVFAAGLAGELSKAAGATGAVDAAGKMSELFRAGAIAGLVGMFSDSAVEKLREIANTVLAKPVSKVTPPAEPGLAEDPAPINAMASQAVTLKGRGLDKVAKVEIGAQTATLVDIKDRLPTALTVTVDGAALGAGSHAIKLDGKDTGKKLKVA